MIDTHAHLDFKDFDEDREEAIQRAFDNGVKSIINVGVDLDSSIKSIALAEKYENVFASVGLHPHCFSKAEKDLRFTIYDLREGINRLKTLAKHKKVVAIGECGLDYYQRSANSDQETIDEKSKELQKKGFIEQIKLARELNLPVVVHCREAWEDVFEIISRSNQSSAFPFLERSSRNSSKPSFSKFVLHCYSGDKSDTEKFLELPNIYFSFSGNITYPKPVEQANKFSEVIQRIPLDRIMLDSDSPYLAPQARRGKRNEPAFVKFIADKIAEIKGISVKEVESTTDKSSINFFGLFDL